MIQVGCVDGRVKLVIRARAVAAWAEYKAKARPNFFPNSRATWLVKVAYERVRARVKKQGRLLNAWVWAEADFASHCSKSPPRSDGEQRVFRQENRWDNGSTPSRGVTGMSTTRFCCYIAFRGDPQAHRV
jgi:hypothetical protein